jgi:NADP-dependent 3-hydroxy acid dehydrogenase YdfG
MADSTEAKVALVTGSSSGIGAATVKLFSQKGFNVVVCGSKQEKVDKVVDECAKVSPNNLKVRQSNRLDHHCSVFSF